MRKKASVASMISVISTDNGVDSVLVWSRLERVLLEIRGASAVMAIYILPGLSVDEGKLIWSHADNGAVALVKLLDAGSQVPIPINPDPENA